uniref:Protein brambleberry n=1 Tax=Oncorhynchus mykiss TaxID=8022 RepID=A0A8C7NLI8_ONCMY
MWTLCLLCVCLPWSSCRDAETAANVAAEGRAELQRVRNLAAQPRYGECWSNALENIDARCRDFTVDIQSRIALRFTHCHLRKSGRSFPACPEGSEVSSCTRTMDPVAFNAYTEFFTHAHSICRHLQSESWQHQAENTIHRLTESSAGVVERLSSTQRMAESLVEAQSVALKSQETILRNGEELKHTLHHSTQGIRAVFDEMRLSTQEQQVAFAEIFNRVTFLQSFIMSESHTLTSLLYNSLGFLAAFFLTSTQRTAPARFVLFGLVVLNVYLERMLFSTLFPCVSAQEQISLLVGLLRRAMVLVGLLALVYVAVRYRNVTKESLEILTQLKETRTSLQLALQKAGRFGYTCLSEAADRRSSGARGRRSEQRPSSRKENNEENNSTSDFTSEKPYMTQTYDGEEYCTQCKKKKAIFTFLYLSDTRLLT